MEIERLEQVQLQSSWFSDNVEVATVIAIHFHRNLCAHKISDFGTFCEGSQHVYDGVYRWAYRIERFPVLVFK